MNFLKLEKSLKKERVMLNYDLLNEIDLKFHWLLEL